MTGISFVMPFAIIYDGNGNPLQGAKVYFYEAGTSTPQDTYSDSTLTTPNSNPVLSDSAGRVSNIYLDSTLEYKVVIKDASDVTIRTIDPFVSIDSNDSFYFGTSTTTPSGTNGLNYTISSTPALTVYPAYVRFSFKCHYTCIDSPTLRLDTLSATSLVKSNGSAGYTALKAGDIVSGKEYIISYNTAIGSVNFVVENPEYPLISNITSVNNTAYTILTTDRFVAQTGTMSAARTFTLPAASSVKGGIEIVIADNSGTVTSTNKISVTRNGSDTIDGATSKDITAAYGILRLISDGSSKWKIVNRFIGKVIQVVNTQTGAVATGTTTLPADDTIPQSTEGDQYMSLAITPTSSTSKLIIDVYCAMIGHSSGNTQMGLALFQDSTANALAAVQNNISTSTRSFPMSLRHYMTAGTTSATTFKVRLGANDAGTTTFNGVAGSRYYGGALASSITITEIEL